MYTNKLVYLQAQYWPLVWGSCGLLRPKIDSSKLVMVDYVCPSRPNSLLMDTEVNEYFFLDYNEMWEVKINDFGQSKYSRIQFESNNMLVAAFAIAATIAFIGALFGVHLSIIGTKELKKKYNAFLIG
jgi:hypothetical protein